jgi:hypothetical protein
MRWMVLVESDVPGGGSSPDRRDQRVEALSRVLAHAHQGEASGDAERWSAKVMIDDQPPVYSAEHAAEAGRHLVAGAAEMVGLPAGAVRCTGVIPALLGSGEVAAKLGVSRQRLHELRSSGRLPAPLAELSNGPIWPSQAIEAFAARWVRRPGPRPGKIARYVAADGKVYDLVATADERTGTVWVPAWLAATQSGLRWIIDELSLPTSAPGGETGAAIFRVPRWEWMARIDEHGRPLSDAPRRGGESDD